MPAEVLSTLTHFGAAGLIAWMWLTERRAASRRERQLDEAHARLAAERQMLDQVVAAIGENTRVLALLEAGQRALATAVDRLHQREGRRAG